MARISHDYENRNGTSLSLYPLAHHKPPCPLYPSPIGAEGWQAPRRYGPSKKSRAFVGVENVMQEGRRWNRAECQE